eukprot:gnl/TRDRNA2_/TRDRNA2_168227_c1_seq3.p1 gnl/TRDRNA2_/TRDRNA2_168227_c1~~gnl/TRDRNA2_/TRDRNA2_168227_c1_seq3.p1  ORF type:complete len:223 (-),score=26.77 gnl/TRDRNA2_/TRDRNA2_168227_c1_seq3:126-794(-)
MEGDVLVRANGRYIRGGAVTLSAAIADSAAAANSSSAPEPMLRLDVFREGKVASVEVTPSLLQSDGATRVVMWHGLVCVATARAMRRAGIVPSALFRHLGATGNSTSADGGALDSPCAGVYVVRVCYGSPAQTGDLTSKVWILEVDGRPIRCLDDLPSAQPESLAAPTALGGDVRVRLVNHQGKESMETLRPDRLFWPVTELRREPSGRWMHITGDAATASE